MRYCQEQQLTFSPRNHQLTNINVWTPDSQWLVYDVRPDPTLFTGLTIERVHVFSGQLDIIYRAQRGAHVGVATVSPDMPPRYIFIHGPEDPDNEWHYDFHHRRGVIVTEPQRTATTLDALDITPPFTAGALRGGSHVHVFSPDGTRVSFTYNDHVIHERDPALDLRNVGVAIPLGSVRSSTKHPREYHGSHFCVLVSRTTPTPKPASDEINRAYEEGWVGLQGYLKPDGSRQRWALAFIGDTLSSKGCRLPEVFIVDLPEKESDYQSPGVEPLQGTATTLPAPPQGVAQRRLTFTAEYPYPGVVNIPRHWLRSAPDGSAIAFLLRDPQGVVQLWTISPNGGQPKQLTRAKQSVQSAFSWSPDGQWLAMVIDNSIMLCDVNTGQLKRLTPRTSSPPLPDAVVFSPDGKRIAYSRRVAGLTQLFMLTL